MKIIRTYTEHIFDAGYCPKYRRIQNSDGIFWTQATVNLPDSFCVLIEGPYARDLEKEFQNLLKLDLNIPGDIKVINKSNLWTAQYNEEIIINKINELVNAINKK